jgi:Flp pilus assembly protein TadG
MQQLLKRLRSDRGDRGSIVLEVTILGPGLLLIVALLVAGGRIALAGQGVEAAAGDAAREASIARNATAARTNAQDSAEQTLQQQGLHCTSINVDINTAGFTAPVGTPAQVTATITCVVALTDTALPGIPGSRTITHTASSPLDTFRERG